MRSSTTNPWTRASSASGGYVRSTNFIGCRRLSRTTSAAPALWRASADTIARMTEVAASSAIIVLRYPFLLGKNGDPNFRQLEPDSRLAEAAQLVARPPGVDIRPEQRDAHVECLPEKTKTTESRCYRARWIY